MKTRLHAFLVALILMATTIPARAQDELLERITFHTGVALDWTPIKFANGTQAFSQTPRYFTLHLGANYLITHSNDVLSLSAELSGNVYPWAILSNGPQEFYFQPGLYMVGRFGANATKYNEQKVGIAVGLGGTYTYLQLPYYDNFTGRSAQFNQWYPSPAGFVEFTVNTRGGMYGLRFHANFLDYQARETFSGGSLQPGYKFGNYGVVLTLGF